MTDSHLADRVAALVRDVPDFPKPGILFKDITPLLADGATMRALVEDLAGRHRDAEIVAGIEARGFVLGAALAHELGVGFVPVAGQVVAAVGGALFGFAGLLLAVPMVQVFINSASDSLASMPIVLAEGVSAAVGQAWPMFAPLIGAMGAFVAGSNTISNMMFSLFQFSTAEQIGLGAAGAGTVVALQAIGGAAGNMICVHNVVAASATVGLVNREGEIIRMTLIPMTYYIVQGGFIGLALLAGGFNMWWIAAVIWGSAVLLFMSRNRGRASNPVAVRS